MAVAKAAAGSSMLTRWVGVILALGVTFTVFRTATSDAFPWSLWLTQGSLGAVLASSVLRPTRPKSSDYLLLAGTMLVGAAVIVSMATPR